MSTNAPSAPPSSSVGIAAQAAVVCGVIAVFVLTWILREVLMIIFGSILLSVMIRVAAGVLIRKAGWRDGVAVGAVVLTAVIFFAVIGSLFGYQISQQLSGLGERLPRAVEQVRAWLQGNPAGRFLLERGSGVAEGDSWMKGVQAVLALGGAMVGHVILMFFGGIFLAANPALYLEGFVRLIPVSRRRAVRAALIEAGLSLRKWLTGQLVAMAAVGTLTGIGLAIVGAPLALVLGITAGLLTFVPVLGPTVAFIPGVLVALTDSPRTALFAAIVYLLVQQIEGHAITPLAQRWAVKLPPFLGMISVVSFGVVFGLFGVMFGSPLAVVCMTLVNRLYVKEGLEHGTRTGSGGQTA